MVHGKRGAERTLKHYTDKRTAFSVAATARIWTGGRAMRFRSANHDQAIKFVSIPVRDQKRRARFLHAKLGLPYTDQPFDDKQR